MDHLVRSVAADGAQKIAHAFCFGWLREGQQTIYGRNVRGTAISSCTGCHIAGFRSRYFSPEGTLI